MEQVSQLPEVDREIAGWKGEVAAVREEITNLQHRLEKIVHLQKQPGSMAQIEHFQNRFICQKEVADELYRDLKRTARLMAKNNEEDDREEMAKRYDRISDRMQSFRRLFDELKSDFARFEEKSLNQ